LLEHFHVAPEDEVRVMPDALDQTVTDIFLKMGMSTSDAELTSEVLVSADVCGVDTHGVSNMLRRYVEMFNDKFVNPTPELKILRETP
jgi:L-2-hydroxycarboxylate dehydrogenase (NAD+)